MGTITALLLVFAIVFELQNADFTERLAMAHSEVTPADLLSQLASDRDAQIRQAVASNPNTSIAVLSKLGAEFPEEIIENPLFKLLCLENPESQFVKLSLARSTTTDEGKLIQLSAIENEEIVCAVARNPKTPISILEEFVCNPPLLDYDENADSSDLDRLFIAIVQNPQASESLLSKLAETGSSYITMAVLEHPKAPLSLLARYADYRNLEMHFAIARNPQAPVVILEKLAGEDSRQIREMVKQHCNVSAMALTIIDFIDGKPGTSVELLEKLASDKRSSVRRRVAVYPETPATILEKLARDTDDVPFRAASHPNANSTVLEFFAEFLVKQHQMISPSNEYKYERAAIQLVGHSQITPKALETLSAFKSYHMMDAIASSPKAPPSLLLKLAEPYCPSVDIHLWRNLAKNPNTPSEALEKLYSLIEPTRHTNSIHGIINIASHPNTPVWLLKQLGARYLFLREVIGKNPGTPVEILQVMASDESPGIRRAVAENENAPVEILLSLAASKDDWVRVGIAKNPKASPQILEKLASDKSIIVRETVASNPNTSPQILEKLARDLNGDVRGQVARNHNTPRQVLEKLAKDRDPKVKKIVKQAKRIAKQKLAARLKVSQQ